jgi:glycosyltransferase involved in cell wall biosynthesis
VQKNPGEGGLSIVIPTINSARYIDIVLGFYLRHQIPVSVLVDDRSCDETFAIAKSLVSDTRLIRNCGTGMEDMLPSIAEMCPARWILRIDDDELPTLGMMQFVKEAMGHPEIDAYGFPRYQCAISREALLLQAKAVSTSVHQQWRLYQPTRVTFHNTWHTPGFHPERIQTSAPASAILIHLDWAVHTYAERLEKIERYDAHTPGEGTKWRSYYLYEEADLAGQEFAELPLSEFAQTSVDIAQRFPDLCVELENIFVENRVDFPSAADSD